jgi:starvation-inducible DNA-binding protein
MSPNLGIDDKDRASVVTMLNALLADEYVLYTKTRNYHWNVVGPQFNDLHKLFGEQYEAIDEFVDDIAERARTLGGHAVATLGEFVDAARRRQPAARMPPAALCYRRASSCAACPARARRRTRARDCC